MLGVRQSTFEGVYMKRFLLSGLLLALVFLNGCVSQKKFDELAEVVKKVDDRLAAIEKLIMPPKEEEQAEAYMVPVGESYVYGKKDARVSIVVFSDLQCPYCGQADKKLHDLLNDPKLKDSVNIVFKHFPLPQHPEARPAAKAALAAGEQGKFFEMAEKIFSNRNEMNQNNYEKWAKELGLDMAKFKNDLKAHDKKYDDLINNDMKVGEEVAKIQGTPWILVGGWLLKGDISPATIHKMIEEKKL